MTQKDWILILSLAIFAILMAVALASEANNDDIVCLWPDGSQTMPNYATKTCPPGSTPVRR